MATELSHVRRFPRGTNSPLPRKTHTFWMGAQEAMHASLNRRFTSDSEHHPLRQSPAPPVPTTASRAGVPPSSAHSPPPAPPPAQQRSALPAPPPPPAAATRCRP